MKTRYYITSKAEALSLHFTIRRKVLNSKSHGKQFHASINMLTLHPDIFKAFGSFDLFCSYVLQHPQNVYYDQLQFSLVITLEIINQKYVYVPIFEIQEQRKKLESLLMLQQAVAIFKKQVFKECFIETFQSKVKQVQWYTQNMKNVRYQCEKTQAQINKIDQQLTKLYKISQDLDGKIQSLEKKQKDNQEQRPKIKQKIRQLFLEGQINWEDPRVKRLKQQPNQTVYVINLGNLRLKSMIFLQPYKNLKKIRLPNNLIKNIEGLQSISELTVLDLNTNKIQVIRGLQNNLFLKQLILHSNNIQQLKNVFHLKNLQILSLSFNKITEVTFRIIELQSLIQLRLENNQIQILPQELLSMKGLKVITLLGNPCFTSKHRMQNLIDCLIAKKSISTISREY